MTNEKKLEEMLIKELVKQMIDVAKSEMECQKLRDKDKEIEGINDFNEGINVENKVLYDLVYKSAWESDKDWLREKLKEACQDLYARSVSKKFPYIELFIIGLYVLVAESRDDLSVDEFQEIINDNCNLVNDLY